MDPSATSDNVSDDLRDDAQKLASAATDRLRAETESRKGEAANQAKALSSALGTAADQLDSGGPRWIKSALQEGAQALDRLSRSVEEQDARQLLQGVRRFARDNPGTFLAGCAALGFAAARVFKAGAEESRSAGSLSQPYDPYSPRAGGGDEPAIPLAGSAEAAASYESQGASI